ncbi:MAG: hypothetical protein J5J06_04080 [Phycisphaerae bacterium]|nr:hypothetical protein [Phycisphaerae bacterium]
MQTRSCILDIAPEDCEGAVRDINSVGAVLAAIRGNDGLLIGLIWHEGETLILPAYGGKDIDVSAINDSGLVVGSAMVDDDDVACFWHQGHLILLEEPDPDWNSCAHDVNERGVIVGHRPGHPGEVAACWVDGRSIEIAPILPEHPRPSSRAESINNRGDIIGKVSFEGFLKRGDQYTIIRAENSCGVHPHKINGRGVVCGWVVDWDEQYAFVFADRLMRLPTIAGSNARALALNDDGAVVGYSTYRAGSDEKHGCIWHDGEPTDLNDLVVDRGPYTIITADAINNSGQIAADAMVNDRRRAVLLNPVL